MEVEKRWDQHFKASTVAKFAHYALYIAIRKYGWENFKKEVIGEYDDYDLDFYEITHIKEENTLTPDGYNILPGGRFGYKDLPIEYQEFYSQHVRKHTNYDIPPGVSEINLPQRNEYGFKVFVGLTTHDFISKNQTMDEKLKSAMECYRAVKAGEDYRRTNHHKWNKDEYAALGYDVPNGVTYRKDKDGFTVNIKIDGVLFRKTFTKKKFTRDERFAQAVAYVNSLQATV